MFWTAWGSNPKIEKAQLDGHGRQVIVSSGLRLPNDITLDLSSNRLYWVDSSLSSLESTDFNGSQRITHRDLSQSQSFGSIPYSLAFYSPYNKFYYSDWAVNKILTFTKGGSAGPTVAIYSRISTKISGVLVDYSTRQPSGL